MQGWNAREEAEYLVIVPIPNHRLTRKLNGRDGKGVRKPGYAGRVVSIVGYSSESPCFWPLFLVPDAPTLGAAQGFRHLEGNCVLFGGNLARHYVRIPFRWGRARLVRRGSCCALSQGLVPDLRPALECLLTHIFTLGIPTNV